VRERDYAGADTLYAGLSRFDLPRPGLLEVWLARLDMVRGRVIEARHHLDAARRLGRDSDPPAVARALVEGAWMELEISGDTARAIQAMEDALRDPALVNADPADMPYLEVADFFVDAGRSDRATAFLETFLSEVPAEYRSPADRWLYVIRGRLAMEEGRLEEAGEAFVAADAEPGDPLVVLQYFGPLHVRADRPDSAIVAYERYLSAESIGRFSFDALLLPGVLQRLAELHEAAGHRTRAADYYNRFADLWSGADPALRSRAEHARRRARDLLDGGAPNVPGTQAPGNAGSPFNLGS
jgi:hypothetical protein